MLVVQGKVSIQQCHDELGDRASISGDYDSNECGLKIRDVVDKDGGSWECEVTYWDSVSNIRILMI